MQKLNTYESTPWVASYQCCIVIYTFISFGLILVSVFNQSILMDQVPQFYSDWDSPLLMDLKIQDTCDKGYTSKLNFTWPGVESGCDCTSSNGTGPYKYTNYYYMECSEFMLQENCKPTAGILQNNFQHWPFVTNQNNVVGYKLCAKLSNYSAMDAFQPNNVTQGYKRCGNFWQVPITDECPISDFTITTTVGGQQIGTTPQYLQFERVQNDLVPITEMTIDYNAVCFINNEIQQFQYLDKMIHYNCKKQDQRYSRVTNDMAYNDLLLVNNQLDEYNAMYQNVQMQSRSTVLIYQDVNLFYKYLTQFYYNTSAACSVEDLDFIYTLNGYIKDNVMDVQLAAEVIVGIQAGVFGFLIPLVSAISLVGCEFKYAKLNRKGSHYKDLFGFWMGVKMIGEILCTIILAADMGYQQSMMNHFYNFIHNDCSDDQTLQEMSDFYNDYEIKVYNYVLLNFILCIITNVFDLYVTYLMCRDKHRQGITVEAATHPKNFTSTHPDELFNKTKVQPQSEKKKQMDDVEIPDDDMAKHVPED